MDSRVAPLYRRWFRDEDHPYRVLDRLIARFVGADDVVLEIGCGRGAPVLRNVAARAALAIGLDVVAFDGKNDLPLIAASADAVPLATGSVDLVFCRSVLEHLEYPQRAFREWRRLLRPGGHVLVLTPNLWDYASLASAMIPGSLHPRLVKFLEGRATEDTFPTFYRANTASRVRRLARTAGLEIESVEHLGQYPSYLTFHPIAFTLGTAYTRMTSASALKHLRPWLLASLKRPA